MLLFIGGLMDKQNITVCFNTSHVTLYHFLQLLYSQEVEFQYISCYSLSRNASLHLWQNEVSIHLMLLFIDLWQLQKVRKNSFNTSHVTLYQLVALDGHVVAVFQYISCYSLSPFTVTNTLSDSSFQYISCYSLSWHGIVSRAWQ